MSDIRLDNAMNVNANVESERANAAAFASSEGALHASDGGAAYDGGASMDAGASWTAPELPEMPDAVADVTAHAEGLADVPELDGSLDAAADAAGSATVDGGSVGLDGMLEGMLDVMGRIVTDFSGSLTALFGF